MSSAVCRKPSLAMSLVAGGALSLSVGVAHGAQAASAATSNEVAAAVVVAARGNDLARRTGLSVMPGALQDTPQTVSVVSAQMLQDQGVTTLDQALRNVPGITVAIGEGGTLNGDQFKIRGQNAQDDVYIDGLRDFGVYTRDSFDYQEVQVLKGPSGAMFGRGTTGGVVNTLSKAPMMMDFADVSASAGSADFYRATVDLNHAFSPTLAARINLLAASSHVQDRDEVRSRRWGVAASVGAGLGTDLSLILNVLHQHDDRIPDYGITIVQPPGQLVAMPASEYFVGVERSSYLGFSTDRDRTTADVFTARLAYEPSEHLSFTSDSRLGVYSRYFQYTTVDRCDSTAATFFCADNLFDGDPATVPNAFIGGGGPYQQNAWGLQNISTMRVDGRTGPLRHQAILGVDLSYQKNNKTFYAYTLPAGITARTLIPRNLLDPDPAPPVGYVAFLPTPANILCPTADPCTTATGASTLRTTGEATDIGLFATERLWLTGQWSLIGSLRWDRYKADLQSVTVAGDATSLSSTSNLLSPRASLVFEPSKDQTYYLSWGRAATPQGTSIVGAGTAISVTTEDLKPETSETFEAGAKLTFLHGRAGATGALFEVRKNNAKQIDPATGSVEAQSGERQRIRGLELAVFGDITDSWSINAGYTYLDAKILESFSCTRGTPVVCGLNPYAIGRQVTYAPRHAASVWTTYRLDGLVPGLQAGAGLTYRSKLYLGYRTSGDAPTPTGLSQIAEVPHSLSVDGLIQYRTARWSLALNGYNLTNRLNYAQVFSNRAVPAAGRTVVLTLGAHF